ncbi:hypothetical protein G5B38_04195 [Pseudohalocynthiibacter aestuariivivens]|nr:hypothetical protein [Pseudohalocynthiibacter aestuariivivens]QIE44791.1 hypothetical protein G5B38_04195 [Pseudohalocynthiibacter aestuariivivens]
MAGFSDKPVPADYRNLMCRPVRSSQFHQGHRSALRATIDFLHDEAGQMNDLTARRALCSTAVALGAARARHGMAETCN